MPDERCHETELNHFWNALNRDIAAPAAVTLDPGQTETLRRLRDMTAATPPAAVRARLDREVRSLLDRPANGSEPVDPRQIQLFIQGPALWQDDRPSPGAAQRPLPRPAAGRIGWAAAQLATVSLVLLALELGMFTVGSGTAVLDRWRGMLSSFGPGSTGDLASETVFAANLPAEMIPAAGNLDFVLWNVALDPGVEGPASSQSWTQTRICCPGPMIVHVLEGVLSMRVEGPLRVFRASNGALGAGAVPPGTEVTLSPGDTAVFSYDLPATIANRGSGIVRMVGGGIFAGAVRSGPAASSAYLDYNEEYSVPRLPSGAVDATLVRATLPPDAEVSAPPAGALVLEVGTLGDADIAQDADGGLRNIGPETATIYILTLTPTGVMSAQAS
jgi:hypothetical protein